MKKLLHFVLYSKEFDYFLLGWNSLSFFSMLLFGNYLLMFATGLFEIWLILRIKYGKKRFSATELKDYESNETDGKLREY